LVLVMMDRARRAGGVSREAALLSALAISLFARAAAADTRDACFTAYEQAQRLRQDGRFVASREQLLVCSEAACPSFVRTDCGAWLGEVSAKLSAVAVVGAHTSADESRVAVYVDGVRLPNPLGGPPTPVDPGPHDIRYELDGRFAERRVVVPEGDKSFSVVVDVGASFPTAAPSAAATAAPTAPNAAPEAPHAADTPAPAWYTRFPVPTYVLGGVAAVGLVSFATFAIAGKASQSCAPSCTHSEVSSLRADYLVADLSLGTAVAAAAGAIYFALTAKQPLSPAPSGSTSPTVWIGLSAGHAGIEAGATF
jgi:hypothetical protein